MSRIIINTSFLALCLAMLAICGCSGGRSTLGMPTLQQRPPDVGVALVLYDSSGPFGYQGDLFAKELTNLLGHFNFAAEVKAVELYTAGEASAYDSLFYIGNTYDNPLPSVFLDDVLTYEKPICWMGNNIWQFTGERGAMFSDRFGMVHDRLNDNYASRIEINYKNCTLTQDPMYPDIAEMRIIDASACAEIATCSKNGKILPYILHSRRLWFIGSIPFAYAGYGDKYFVFADVLHDILGINHAVQHTAFLRIEDVSPYSDPHQLRLIADVCAESGVPFGISVIPIFRDPLLAEGSQSEMTFTDRPEVVDAIRYMVGKGGQIIQHGLTHQYSELPNPINGATATDYEFFLVSGSPNELNYLGPVPEDSEAWARDRVLKGYRILQSIGLHPLAWNTPHYLASEADYPAFASIYSYNCDSGVYFTRQTGAAPTRAMLHSRNGYRAGEVGGEYFVSQIAPYPLWDIYNCIRIPETIGYLQDSSDPPITPEVIVERASNMRAVRDGWASLYFHWYADPDQLKQLIVGVKGLGYEFTGIPN